MATMPPPRTLEARLRRIDVLAPPLPPPDPDELGVLLGHLTEAELVFVSYGRCDDAALIELLERARDRRDRGEDMAEVERLEQESACWWPRGDGLMRRVVPHPARFDSWMDAHDATEGLIE
jgi:hypothetical protein